MAMFDWNHNGKKDWQNNYLEYQIYKEVTNQKVDRYYKSQRGNGMSSFGVLISVAASY